MKLRDFQIHTYGLCMAFLRNPTVRNTDRLVRNLRRWTRHRGYWNLDDYGYKLETSETLANTISYCSDRMNQGRAKAILRLMDEDALMRLESMFRAKGAK